MASLDFKFSYGINEGVIMSPSELKDIYLFGIELKDRYGRTIPDDTLMTYIKASQDEIEKFLMIKLIKQIVYEKRDFTKEDWRQWGYLRVSYPVWEIFSLKGFVNSVQQMDMPKEWLSIRRSNTELQFRQVHLIPIASTSVQYSAIYNGVVPLGFFMNTTIPNYWDVIYGSGFEKTPQDLFNIIGKLSALNIFKIMGYLILGTPGLMSQSISLDGLSQNYTVDYAFKNLIQQYLEELKITMPQLYNYYKGFTAISM